MMPLAARRSLFVKTWCGGVGTAAAVEYFIGALYCKRTQIVMSNGDNKYASLTPDTAGVFNRLYMIVIIPVAPYGFDNAILKCAAKRR